jgi:hypothetical protein
MDKADSFEADDLLESLGVEIPWPDAGTKKRAVVECGQKAPALRRHTEWNNFESFEFKGWVAMVAQITCNCCGSVRERLDGIFTCEVKVGTGARRLQAIASNGDWPVNQQHTVEVRQEFTRFCPDCVRGLGFSREVEQQGAMNDITIR